MTLKLFKAVWFLSVVVLLGNLLYVYASLPEVVVVQEHEQVLIGRELLFYILVFFIVAVNSLVYLFKWLFPEGESVRSWFHGFIITVNIYAIIALHALNVYNSHETFDHGRVAPLITGSLILLIVWAASWPVYRIFQRIFVKQAV